ncbi:TonB-dependent receptor [Sphingobacterium nematocida]|nr:TonB-dependent receptor [Sphingobacterium nematocida]
MKLTFICTVLLTLNSWAAVHSQSITIHGKNVRIADFFKLIKEQTGYDIVSKAQDIQNINLNLNLRDTPLEKALDIALESEGLTYKINKKAIVISRKTAPKAIKTDYKATTYITTTQNMVTGKVINAQEKPIAKVTVKVVNSDRIAETDNNGNFRIHAAIGDILQFSFIGYNNQRITISSSQALTVRLVESNQDLDEVVVVGFGTQRKTNITGAVATVDTKRLESRPVTSVAQALQGTVPGLNISAPALGGELGQNMNINIRGTGTISTGSTASTLVLIDGVEGNINNINPDDIESISVLKDASAASIYGSRAAFGVILVTTKSGKAGVSSISYSNNFRNTRPTNLPKLLNSYDFANYFNESALNDGGQVIFDSNTIQRIQDYIAGKITTTTIPNEGNGNWQFHERANDNVNWYDVHYKNAWSVENNLNISGGSEKYQYYGSANYLNQNGNLRYGEDKYKRFQSMAKINAQLNDLIDVKLTTRFVRSNLDNPYYNSLSGLLYHDIVRMWPMMPFKDPNGHYMRNGKLAQLTSGSRSITNNDNLFLQGQIVLHPAKGWNIYAEAGLRTVNENNQSNVNSVREYNVKGEPLLLQFDGSRTAGATEASQYYVNQNMYTTSVYSDYTTKIDNHAFKLMVGANTEMFKYRTLGALRPNLYSESVPEISAAGGTDKITSASVYDWATAGFFGRLNYDFDDKYLVEFNLRYDGSSRYLRDQRWSLFPSVSVGWNMAKESFMNTGNYLSVLKPRISWGRLGNQNTIAIYPFYLTQPISANSGSWLIGGSKPTVATVPGMISSTLTWEKIETLNIGFDAVAFQNRLQLNFDYFTRTTDGMVGPAAEIGAVFGTSLPNTNNATLENKGWELVVNWNDKIGNLGYTLGANISDNTATVKKYPNASKSLSTFYNGQVLGEIWGYETEGIAKSQEQMNAWLENNKPTWGSNWGEGDIMYRDLNGDKEVNAGSSTLDNPGDRKIIGNNSPRYLVGFNLGMDWKGFDFSAFLQGVAKRDAWLGDPNFWGVGSGQWQSTGFEEHLDYYRPEGTTSVFGANTDAYYPRPYIGKGMNQEVQTKYLQNASYLRLKNIQLGYTISENILQRSKIKRARVYFSAENLFTITSISDVYDPEAINGPWGNGKTYPLSKTFSFGCNITF